MEWSSVRVAIMEVIIKREEVHIMHHHVVTLVTTQEETNIQKRGTIKPVRVANGQH